MKWTVEEIPELKGYTVEWAEADNFYLSRRNILFQTSSLKPPFKQIAAINAPFWKQTASKFRLAQRLLRFQVTNVIPLANGDLFVTFDKSVGVVRNGKFQTLNGLARPCRVLRSACAVNEAGDIFFGEYLANNERGEMRIYKFKAGSDTLKTIYTFPPNSIKHIHGLYFDSFSKSIFCLTGDDEKECQILRSFDEFQTTEIVGQGDETWRAVSVLFTEKAFFYGMDAEFRANRIYKVERQNLRRQILAEVGGTVFYSKQLGTDLFFTTTAENAPSQTENVATLWRIDANLNKTERMVWFEKDRWHPTLFQFGTIHFPCVNKLENRLYFHLVGVEGDNRTFCIKQKSV
jgi:hypothetical protein